MLPLGRCLVDAGKESSRLVASVRYAITNQKSVKCVAIITHLVSPYNQTTVLFL